MDFHPCRRASSPNWPTLCGNNAKPKSPATSQSHPLHPSKPCSKGQSSTAKTNKLRPCESSAHASTFRQWKTPAWMRRFSKPLTTHQIKSYNPWCSTEVFTTLFLAPYFTLIYYNATCASTVRLTIKIHMIYYHKSYNLPSIKSQVV